MIAKVVTCKILDLIQESADNNKRPRVWDIQERLDIKVPNDFIANVIHLNELFTRICDEQKATDRLVNALQQAIAPIWIIDRARQGYYRHSRIRYDVPQFFPAIELVNDLRICGLTDIALRATDGEFDTVTNGL